MDLSVYVYFTLLILFILYMILYALLVFLGSFTLVAIILFASLLTILTLSILDGSPIKVSHDHGYHMPIPSLLSLWSICPDLVLISPFKEL